MPTPKIQSVGRAFALLSCLARHGGRESLPAMAAECGLTVPTAHRLLATLESVGAVCHTAPGDYRMGIHLLDLAEAVKREQLFAIVADPTLRRMVRQLCPMAHVGVLNSELMVSYLAKASQRAYRLATQVGGFLEAYCSGLGKVLLAALPEQALADYLGEGPFVALTSNTIVDPASLQRDLAVVRRQGYAVDNCEIFDDLRCVAVPIYGRHGGVEAALSACFPADQLPLDSVGDVAGQLAVFSSEIGAKLFPRPPPPSRTSPAA